MDKNPQIDSPVPLESCLVLVARHGETSLNAAGRFRGNSNPPLNESGLEDAHDLADILESIEVSHIVSSDKTRAKQTAGIIAAKKHQPVHTSANLRALDVGDFSGQKRTKANTDALQHYLDNPSETIPGGESLDDFRARVAPCLAEAADMAIESGAPVVLVAHSSIVHEVGQQFRGDHNAVLVKPGGMAVVYINSRGQVDAAPVYRTDHERIRSHAETIS